jgi:hypothetical protein
MTLMLRKAEELKCYTLGARDGEIGRIDEFYFDDQHWTIRYLIVGTGGWLTDRRVLISPYALGATDEIEKVIPTELTKKQIAASPSLSTDKPVSRQFEEAYYGYYGWPIYWNGPFMWGTSPYLVRDIERPREYPPGAQAWDSHLRSTTDVTGDHVQAQDGDIGHVEDFVIDDETWAIRYLIVDTSNWWFGKKVLMSPRWIERVSWPESKVFFNLPRETIRQAPEYTEESLNRGYEMELHRHYKYAGYWVDEYRKQATHSHA